mgnify:CR=1 FL=1
MLDPDISTEDALHLLSRPDHDDERPGPHGWTRRRFLQAIGAGVFGGAAVGSIAGEFFGGDIPEAWAGSPIGPNDGILVVVTLYGGYDGLNTFVPYGDGNYQSRRPNVAIPAQQVLAVDGNVGFAPQLTYMKALYDAGMVAAIQGTGYANPDYDRLFATALDAPDEPARMAVYRQLDALLTRDVPVIPLYFYKRVYLLSPKVQGWAPNILDTRGWQYIDLQY